MNLISRLVICGSLFSATVCLADQASPLPEGYWPKGEITGSELQNGSGPCNIRGRDGILSVQPIHLGDGGAITGLFWGFPTEFQFDMNRASRPWYSRTYRYQIQKQNELPGLCEDGSLYLYQPRSAEARLELDSGFLKITYDYKCYHDDSPFDDRHDGKTHRGKTSIQCWAK